MRVPYDFKDEVEREREREYYRKYRAGHREELNEYNRKYYAAHKQERDEYARKYRAENREKILEYGRKYCTDHRGKLNKRSCKYNKEHPEQRRGVKFKYLYGITTKDYGILLAAQGGACALCGRPPGKTDLRVDHDHVTGTVRGLLCHKCNVGLGHFDEDQSILKIAIEYLSERG